MLPHWSSFDIPVIHLPPSLSEEEDPTPPSLSEEEDPTPPSLSEKDSTHTHATHTLSQFACRVPLWPGGTTGHQPVGETAQALAS